MAASPPDVAREAPRGRRSSRWIIALELGGAERHVLERGVEMCTWSRFA